MVQKGATGTQRDGERGEPERVRRLVNLSRRFAEVMALRMRLGSVMHLGSETKQEAAQNYA